MYSRLKQVARPAPSRVVAMSGAMDTESRFVPRADDTYEERTFFKWCLPCCGEDECSKRFDDRVKNFTSYKSRDVVRKHMINHLFNGWTHKKYRTWQLAAERVAEYLELHPDAIEEKTETYEERENYRVEMENCYQTKVEQDNEDQDNYEPIDGPHQPAYPPDLRTVETSLRPLAKIPNSIFENFKTS